MLAELFSWWAARMREVLPAALTGAAGTPDGVVIEPDPQGAFRAFARHNGHEQTLPLGAVPRLAGHRPVLLRPPAGAVLEKIHVMPAASRAEMEQMLRLELHRITPFGADAVYWQWDGRPRPNDRGRSDIRLTIVPKISLAPALDALDRIGIRPNLLELTNPARLLPLSDDRHAGSRRGTILRVLGWLALALGVTAAVLPFLLQVWALHRTDAAMQALRPALDRVEELRRGIDASAAGNDIVARELARNGDVPAILAAVTRVLPDDTYLNDLSLRQRQLTIGGRSKAAANLITAMASEPAFRDVAFAAPVTRIDGADVDIFTIKAEIAR